MHDMSRFPLRRPLALALALCALLAPALGDTALALTAAEVDAGNRAAQKIQQEQQERQQQQMREDMQRRGAVTQQALPEVQAPSLPKSGYCRTVNKVVLRGADILSEGEKARLTAPYENRCLYAEDIEKLLGEVLKAYMDKGYVSVRPYVQAQGLEGGRLEILIVEGRVEGLILKGEGFSQANLDTAFPFVAGRPLNLRDIEQGLDQLNRLASNNATMEISPGAEAGASVVTIKNNPGIPLSVSGGMDNLGGLSTGRQQGSYTLSFDNPLRLNDYITYTHRNTLYEEARYRESVSDSFFYSLPFGYWTVQLSYSMSSYRSPVVTASGTTLVAQGASETLRAELNRVLYRDQDQKLTALLAINSKSTRNHLADEFLAVSSRNLAVLDLDMNWTRRFALFSANLGLGWSKGVRQFNAKVDDGETGVDAPHAQGAKLRYTAGLSVPFALLGQDLNFSSQLTGQFALDPLYGSEQMSIGSFYTVRGFNRHSISGDRGWYVRNEISAWLPVIPYLGSAPRPFVAFDAGRIEAWNGLGDANFTSVAGGLRLSGKRLSGELSAAKALSIPKTLPHEPVQIAATMTLSF